MGTIREDLVTSLAIRLRRNMLSADEFQRELESLSRGERVALVDYLDRMEKGPVELYATASSGPGSRL
jgi:hypothetical protein